jgi:hypothetical protein
LFWCTSYSMKLLWASSHTLFGSLLLYNQSYIFSTVLFFLIKNYLLSPCWLPFLWYLHLLFILTTESYYQYKVIFGHWVSLT